ncbi:MAG: ABC transporter permease [Opitutaceae bacterium]
MNLLQKIGALFRRKKLDAEMAEEMRAHLDLQTRANRASGMSGEEARYAARRQFGDLDQIKERCRDERRGRFVWLEQFLQDLRYAAASLLKHPVFSLTAVLTLALGLGVTTSIFTIVDTVLWRPLPYAEPWRLVNSSRFTGQTLRDWQGEQQVLDRVETHQFRSMVLTGGADAMQVFACAASPGTFDLLGRAPAMGRPFTPGDAEAGNNQVTMLSHGFWQQHFGGDPNVVGKTLMLDDQRYQVIGVMPRGFAFPRPNVSIWTPLLRPKSEAELRQRVEMVGRLRPGLGFVAAKEAVKSLNQRLNETHPLPRGWDVVLLAPEQSRVNPGPRRMMQLFLGAVGFVLLIACTNVANLLLVRAAVRQREFAVRAAIGAGGGRLIRQVLTESLLLVVLGAGGGVLFAQWAAKAIWLLAPNELTFLTLNEVNVDWRVMGFTAGVIGLATVICGLIPALRAARVDTNQALGSASRTTTGNRRQQWWQQSFVVAQSALAFVLLIGAGLLMRGFLRLSEVRPGFETRNLVALSVQLPAQRYPSSAQRRNFFEQLRERTAALPGVAATTLATGIPPNGGGFSFSVEVEVEGHAPQKLATTDLLPFNTVEDSYFQLMQIPVLRGRSFDRQDVPGGPPAIVINDQMARRFWPNADPVGQRVRFDPRQPWLTVVGVAGDVKAMNLNDENGSLEYYRAMRQEEYSGYSSLVVRTSIDPQQVMPAIRQQVAAIDSKLPIGRLSTAEELMAGTLAVPRFFLVLMILFAGAAILLAAIGLYGVMSYTVARRTPEIGIRIALGGEPGAIMRLVARRGLILTGGGLLVGIAAAAALTRFLETMLFEVSALDPATFAVGAVLLGFIGACACWIPARRAAKVDPMVALRAD